MKVRLSIEYEVEDENPEIEKLGAELIRAEADALVESVKRKLRAAGVEVTSSRPTTGSRSRRGTTAVCGSSRRSPSRPRGPRSRRDARHGGTA